MPRMKDKQETEEEMVVSYREVLSVKTADLCGRQVFKAGQLSSPPAVPQKGRFSLFKVELKTKQYNFSVNSFPHPSHTCTEYMLRIRVISKNYFHYLLIF